MQIRNENVACYNCKYNLSTVKNDAASKYTVEMTAEQKKERNKACRKCATRNGYFGWFPALGVNVQETKGWTFTAGGKPVETIFRKVVD